VLCLVNGTSLPRGGMRDHRLAVGDEILIHQAISGG
jgi:sulfur carrier protein ThiS